MDYSWAKVGVKCVCVDAGRNPFGLIPIDLKQNTVYTIKNIYDSESKIYIDLEESSDFGYSIDRFRPLSEIRIEKFKQMINNIPSSFYNEVVKESECV